MELIWFPIRGDFADAILTSFSGGVVEIEFGAACTSQATADSLAEKINKALEETYVRDISLWLTPDEAKCLAIASENCAYHGLPKAQRDRVDKWFGVWKGENPDELSPWELGQLAKSLEVAQ